MDTVRVFLARYIENDQTEMICGDRASGTAL